MCCLACSKGWSTVSESHRLFFALWPDDVLRTAIVTSTDAACGAMKGRRVPAQNLHATLAFLGSVNPSQRECVESAGDAVVAHAFALELDQLGHFPRPQVLWLAPRASDSGYTDLVSELHSRLASCGYQADRRAYRPHITLMRKVRRAPREQDIAPLRWRVDSFVLVRSDIRPEGARYEVLRTWKLTTPHDAS